ncbi:hypothetical protein [Streptomyces sp. SS162]|uniref:hypothetical protein n=1 Tax=Streptomyces sp. SS162 TaxID=3108484 RepID=UPI002F406D65
MRVRVATTALGITAALLAVPACTSGAPDTTTSSPTGKPARSDQNAAPLSSAILKTRLLDESDLGSGYARKPERSNQHDDVTVIGCPALNELGGEAATGGTLTFPRKAKATFTYADSTSEISEELYSDSADKLSDGIGRIFDTMTGCPQYQVLVGGTAIDMTTQEVSPSQRGDEGWSQLLTFSTGGRDTVVKQTAIRDGNVLLILSGSPTLVDLHLNKAHAKLTAAR